MGCDKCTIAEQSTDLYVITENYPGGPPFSHRVTVTAQGIVLSDDSNAGRVIAVQLLNEIGRTDLADKISKGDYLTS